MNILGVKVDNLDKKEILEKIESFLREDSPSTIQGKVLGKFHQIATINPEFILQAQKDEEFKNILNSCDLNVADGVGIWFAFLRFGKYLKSRITGADLMEEILKIATENNLKIFLAANDGGLSSWEEVRNAILKKYPNLTINGANLETKSPSSLGTIEDYDIVFCNFGAPEQEKFLHSLKNLENGLPPHLYSESNSEALSNSNSLNSNNFDLQNQRCRGKIRLAMGVGGSFDFITGKIKRAPIFMRKLGLEWLWRLILEPKYRLERIFNAIIIFPIKVLLNKKENEPR